MIMITGGLSQGKLKVAAALLQKELQTADCACGDQDGCEDMFGKQVIYGFHHYIRRMQRDGMDWEYYVERILHECRDSVVILDEVGCGIVPMGRDEREYRETVGLAGQRLAAGADHVYRVICGIGTRIK